MSSRFQAILFDLDDTLVDLSTALPIAWDAARQLCVECTGISPDLYEDVSAEIRNRLFAELDAGKWKLAEVRYRMFAETLERLHLFDEALVERLHLAFGQRQLDELKLFADAHVLWELQARVRLGIVTNGACDDHPESQWSKIKHFGLDKITEFQLISDHIGYRKPRPEIFRLAIERLALRSVQILFVGDSLSNDVAGAGGVGMVPVWLNRTGEAVPPNVEGTHVIQSLIDLERLLS